ncbi:amino acid ABC transporter permease [Nitriliruptoraceae bacterium ZYF776]|nr:amino acid ABC transporter permease [Profundirhabdus halotolerans]
MILTGAQYRQFLQGLQVTLTVLGYAFVIGVVLSLVFGVLRLSSNRIVRGVALVYVEFFRGISAIILLFIMAYGLPILLGVGQGNRLLYAAIALGLNMGGYGAEIVRGSILAVPKGQTEASIALNLTPFQRLRLVVLPQALRIILPPFGNLTIEILKGTALVSLVALADLAQVRNIIRGQQLAAGTYNDVALLFNILVIYFVVAQVIAGLFRVAELGLERRYRTRRGELPPLPDAAANAEVTR